MQMHSHERLTGCIRTLNTLCTWWLQTPDHLKTRTGEEAFNDNGLVQRSIRLLKDTFPDLEVRRLTLLPAVHAAISVKCCKATVGLLGLKAVSTGSVEVAAAWLYSPAAGPSAFRKLLAVLGCH